MLYGWLRMWSPAAWSNYYNKRYVPINCMLFGCYKLMMIWCTNSP
jgi:hypothetical protein